MGIKDELTQINERLYRINAGISGMFITKMRNPTYDDMVELNTALADVIKDLRTINSKIKDVE